jgi:hypothetical protein
MGVVLLGHGSLDVNPLVISPDMETVAIPQGVTIQFYCDTNQSLAYSSHQLDIWEQLQAPWPPLDSSHVTYNLVLENAVNNWKDELANDPQFGGNRVILPGLNAPDPLCMCTGNPDTCPTKPEQVANGMTHNCDGILGHLQGDLYWIACTTVVFPREKPEAQPEQTAAIVASQPERAAANAVIEGKPRTVFLGDDPDWVPDEVDQQTIARINGVNVQNAGDGAVLEYDLGGFAFLIGDGHNIPHVKYAARNHQDQFTGQVKVCAGKAVTPARLQISGVPPYKQGIVQAAVSLFSDAVVVFT